MPNIVIDTTLKVMSKMGIKNLLQKAHCLCFHYFQIKIYIGSIFLYFSVNLRGGENVL